VQPSAGLELMRQATRRLLRSVGDLTDDDVRDPCRLPGWNRAELLTHLARNADGLRGMVEGAARNEMVPMYPSVEARAAGIAAGRDEPAAVVRADVRRACDALAEAFESLPGDAWDRVALASVKRPIYELPWVRLREIEVHHVDLDWGYEPTDWPVPFVTGALDELFSTFDRRAASTRPPVDADYRVVTTDHERAWSVRLRGVQVAVDADGEDPCDGEARGWGCDVAAWLYGRDPRGGAIVATGDLGVLRLPQWFPFS
jgi:maleylpyruvate isomerase